MRVRGREFSFSTPSIGGSYPMTVSRHQDGFCVAAAATVFRRALPKLSERVNRDVNPATMADRRSVLSQVGVSYQERYGGRFVIAWREAFATRSAIWMKGRNSLL